jgi:hypothetical protein
LFLGKGVWGVEVIGEGTEGAECSRIRAGGGEVESVSDMICLGEIVKALAQFVLGRPRE